MFHIGVLVFVICLCWSLNIRGDISEQRLWDSRQGRGVESDASATSRTASVPDYVVSKDKPELADDPCLPPLYKDWQEFSIFSRELSNKSPSRLRIVIDRTMFELVLEELGHGDETPEIVYKTEVALGDLRSPTPEGSFIINHIYCYADVMFFTASQEKVANLYNGFFAPLLRCDAIGKCQRYKDLGIHGFCPEARPNPTIRPETFGAVSAGCIRLPDPCTFKKHLIMRSSLGPRRINERGSYHWLKKPVEVLIVNGYLTHQNPQPLLDVFVEGLEIIGSGFDQLFRRFAK